MATFYGNIINKNRANFIFDRIYSNRVEMEQNAAQDNVYLNRYVLIEYSANFSTDSAIQLQRLEADGTGYTTNDKTSRSLVTVGDVKQNLTQIAHYNNQMYNCTNLEEENEVAAVFKLLEDEQDTYNLNANIDKAQYGAFANFDSTVWQKIYTNGAEKYIMIAELNTFAPLFQVSSDAPTPSPLPAHYDTESTNLNYILHQQVPWGFQIKRATSTEEQSTDTVTYPSDEQVTYNKVTYDSETGETSTVQETYNGAIYYNKDGFKVEKRNFKEGTLDQVSMLPTGYSGQEYNNHDGSGSTSKQVDIQELKVILPSIGNTISQVWDLVYGYNTDTGIRYRDIKWKDPKDTTPDSSIGGMTRDLETLAGSINTLHDWMGMIITNSDRSETLNEVEYNKGYIYQDSDTNEYYRIAKYTNVADSTSYSYKWVKIPDLGIAISSALGAILELQRALSTDVPDNMDQNTLQGVLNKAKQEFIKINEEFTAALQRMEEIEADYNQINSDFIQINNEFVQLKETTIDINNKYNEVLEALANGSVEWGSF